MKLRNIVASFLAVAAMAVGCTDELIGNLSSIKLDQSTIVFPEQGGSATITVTATTDWSVDAETVPAEVTVSPMSGNAGETKMTISTASGSLNDIASDIVINAGKQKQFIKFFQPGDPALKPKFDEFEAGDYWIMCKEGEEWFALKGTGVGIDDNSYNYLYSDPAIVAEDGSLSSTASNVFTFEAVEGGFVIKDPTGGYLYQAAKYHNFYMTADIAKAAVWTVQQTSEDEFMLEIPDLSKWMQYSTSYDSAGAYPTAQEGATLPKLVKAEDPAVEPFVIEQTEFSLPMEAGELVIPVVYNGSDIHVGDMPAWLSFYGYHDGNIRFTYEENTGGNREAKVILTTCMEDGREAEVELTFMQEGSIVETTADQINAAEDGATLYRITGVVKSIANTTYGNIYIADYTGEVYVYGTYDAEGNRFDAFATPVNVGDIVTVCGVKTSHNGNPQMKNVTVEKHIVVPAVTVAEFLAAEVASDVYYCLTGTVSGLANAGSYGNIYLTDEAGDEVYVYGLLAGWGGPKAKFQDLVAATGLKDGDKLTIVGVRAAYNSNPQVGSAFYVSHEAVEGGEDTPATGFSVSFADKANRTVFTAEQQVWEQNGVTVTNDKASSTNDVADYASPARFYKGSSLTVAMDGMKKIEFFCNDNKATYPTDLNASISDSNATVTVDGTTVTVEFTNAVDTFVIASLAGQVRMNSLTVYTE